MKKRLPALVFAVLAAVNLCSVAFNFTTVEWISKPLLMPTLAWLLVARGPAPRTRHWLLVGLAAATAADVALLIPGETALLVGIGFFAAMQLCFITAYSRVANVVARWMSLPWLPVVYVVFWLCFNTVMWTSFGDMAIPIAIYSLLLTIMAATAATVSAPVGAGGLLFLISDLMIGLGIANIDFTGRSVAIMATYSAAQFFIVWGLTRRTDVRPAPGSTGTTAPAAG